MRPLAIKAIPPSSQMGMRPLYLSVSLFLGAEGFRELAFIIFLFLAFLKFFDTSFKLMERLGVRICWCPQGGDSQARKSCRLCRRKRWGQSEPSLKKLRK